MFNEANKQQVLELQNDCYSERVGKVYGDFKVVDVWYDWNSRKQMWKLQCQKCGDLKITHNGKDYSKGKNKGICGCEARQAKNAKAEKIAENKKDLASDPHWIGTVIGMWKILSYNKDKHSWLTECQNCGKTIYHLPRELKKQSPVRCTCTVVRGNYKSSEWIGKRFGHLVTTEYLKKECEFKCKCDCGNFVQLKPSHLIDGNQVTCGLNCKYHLAQSQKETQGFTEYEATYTAAKEAMLEDVIERLEAILYA